MESELRDYLCPACGMDFSTLEEFQDHKGTDIHRVNYLHKKYHGKREYYLKDKNGIAVDIETQSENITYSSKSLSVEIISIPEDNEIKEYQNGKESSDELSFIFSLVNNGKEPQLLTNIDILNKTRLVECDTQLTLHDNFNISNKARILKIGPERKYEVTCILKVGMINRQLHIPVLFEFRYLDSDGNLYTGEKAEAFYVGRSIAVKGSSYKVRNFGNYVKGVYPDSKDVFDELEREVPLRYYDIPEWFQTLAYNNNPREIRSRMHITPNITPENHFKFFQTLLWLEELQEELDIQFYSKREVTLNFSNARNFNHVNLVELNEPGLAENRPCVMRKDKVFACLTEEANNSEQPQWYEGYVHRVNNTSVSIGFHQDRFFSEFNSTTKFNIEFAINRHCFKVCHRAVDFCKRDSLEQFLFPSQEEATRIPNLPQITPYDGNTNPEQLQAVKHIVANTSSSAPYIVFGPPGTGKTVTIVESIKQILYQIPKSYVLACAPSNTAADVITERLLDHFTEDHVFRMYAESRTKHLENLPPKLLAASNYLPYEKVITFPSKDYLKKKRVIVCTFVSAYKLASAKFPRDHFTHVILDEVGHAMECEALVGIGGILSPEGQIILAGDPHQLGPLVRNLQASSGSSIFPKTALDTSLLERLMKMPLYNTQEGGYDPRFVTKLVKNYRSHRAILHIPNKLFYKSELQAKGDLDLINYMTTWKHLPSKGFPLIVHSIRGDDKMEKHSPSYHNPSELQEVLKYLRKLLDGKPKISGKDIGIITPYRLQVEKFRYKIRAIYGNDFLNELKVGSVEDFQGEERKVIIISTVRATSRHLAKDNLFKLGFLKNPKRFNVAVTRAQCLLILVCCADVLVLDHNWKSLIDHAEKNGGYVGQKYRTPKVDIDGILSQMENLDLRPTVGDISQKQMVEVPSMKTS